MPFFLRCIVLGICFIHFSSLSGLAQQIRINEVMASNKATIYDDFGEYSDWIELYYWGDEPLSLDGYGLSDDYDLPFKWVFPDVLVEKGDLLLVWASGKDRRNPESSLHTNFSISSQGEEIILTTPEGERLDEMPPVPMPSDVSRGRLPDGTGEWKYFDQPTPRKLNKVKGFDRFLYSPVFSHRPGYYQSEIKLAINTPDQGVKIYYTLDGSDPDENSNVYEGAIKLSYKNSQPTVYSYIRTSPVWNQPKGKIRKITVVKAKAIASGAIGSTVSTSSYLFFPEANRAYTMPVVSLSSDPENLFDRERGIYVPGKIYDEKFNESTEWFLRPANYRERGREWERPGHVEFFENDGTLAFKADVGLRIHGGASRAYPVKPLRVIFRSVYDDKNRLHYPLFPEQPHVFYKQLLFRNSGSDYSRTLFRDACLQLMVKHLGFSTQAYRPAIVFLNGEYWGIHNIRERFNKDFFEGHFGIEVEELDLLENNRRVIEGSLSHYRALERYIEQNDVSDSEHYNEVKRRMDEVNFMHYQISQIYFRNTDWPGNNMRYWRKKTVFTPDAPDGHDGRWRWLLYDTDFGFGGSGGPGAYIHNTMEFATEVNGPRWPNPPWGTFLLRSLLQNEAFKHEFITRFADHLNTTFTTDRAIHLIDSLQGVLRPEIPGHIDRWGTVGGSVRQWERNVEIMRIFARNRPFYMREHIRNFFNIAKDVPLTVEVSSQDHGYVRVNTVDIRPATPGVPRRAYPWTGIYFHNIPVKLSAHARLGFEFSHWEGVPGNSKETQVELTLQDATKVKAVFNLTDDIDAVPKPHILRKGSYVFDYWDKNQASGTFPDHMAFVYMDEADPGLDARIEGFTSGAYNLTSRTRINGLGDNGFSFINTANEEGNEGYPGVKLGGALLGLNTRERENVRLRFTAGTLEPNSRVYHIRVQYRVGDKGPFKDVLDEDGKPLEYERSNKAGHLQDIGPVRLPNEVENRPYVQVLFRYYHTGRREDASSGQRSELNIARVKVEADQATLPGKNRNFILFQNYPNPFGDWTKVKYRVLDADQVYIDVIDRNGKKVATLYNDFQEAGTYTLDFNASALADGLYLCRMQTSKGVEIKKFLVVR
jgi:hypothetical protein